MGWEMSCLPTPPTVLKQGLACTCRQTDKQTDKTARPTPKNDPRERRRKKKKKTRRGGDLGESEEQGVRVEHVVRVQDEESQGETQTPNGVWVSPAPERKRKTSPSKQPNKQRERERGDTNKISDRGQVLKGTQPNNIPSPEKNIVQKYQQ